jgi:hypothetical protein
VFPVPLPQGKGSNDEKQRSSDIRQKRSLATTTKAWDKRKKSPEYHFCLPENIIVPLQEIEKQPPDIVGFSMTRLKYLISIIVTHVQDKHPGSYSLLNMVHLQSIVPRAGEYLRFLKDKGLVEWINHSSGRNSRLYRITKPYQGRIIYRTITDKYLIRRIEHAYQTIRLQNSKKYPFLNRYVNMVDIDESAAFETIEQTFAENPDKENAAARRSFSMGELLKIKAGHIYIGVNNTNHRYDTNFTRLPGELVKHLSINGKSLLELDIRNSQPFFAVSLFDPSPEIQQIIGYPFTMYAKSLHLTEKHDVKLYTSLVTTGKFYDYMAEQFEKHNIPIKDNFKEQCFMVFFGKNNAVYYRKAVRLFSEIFPNVYKLFAMIKEGDHSRLAIILQRIEAHIMLDRVATKIHQIYPEMEFITKHDSILPAISPEEAAEIEKLIKKEIAGVIGYAPEIRIKGP